EQPVAASRGGVEPVEQEEPEKSFREAPAKSAGGKAPPVEIEEPDWSFEEQPPPTPRKEYGGPTATAPPPRAEPSVAPPGIDEQAFQRAHAGPGVRKLARELGADLGRTTGTGPKGRTPPEDLYTFVKSLITGAAAPAAGARLAAATWPKVNSSREGDQLVVKKYWNIAFGADTPQGLVVPVVKDADKKGVFVIAKETGELAAKARDGKLTPGDMQGATFTISSLGGIGGTYFTPIINAPEVAILGVCRAQMRPVWNGSECKPRLILPLS